MTSFLRKLGWLARTRRKEVELDEELRFHLDEEAEQFRAGGLTGEEARQAARRDLGNLTSVKENTRATWSWTFLEQFLQDLRYGARAMVNNRAFTALAALSLALGIGANTAIYSFMDAILLRALPVPDPASLVVLNWHAKMRRVPGSRESNFVMHAMSGSTFYNPKSGFTGGIFPYPAFELIRKNNSIFSSVFGFHGAGRLNVLVAGQADVAAGEYVSGGYFGSVGIAPAAGRLLVEGDDRPGAPAVAVLSLAFSRRHFGEAVNAPGKTILINNVPFTVVGVTAPEFFGVDPAAAPALYLPMHADLLLEARSAGNDPAAAYLNNNYYWVQIMARLRPGVSLTQAHAALAVPFHEWAQTTASNGLERGNLPELTIAEGAGGLDTLRREYSKPLFLLLALVALILAIACANIANLLLARATARRREIALRLSLGAGRLRVVRQLLTESVLLASLGGILGILVAIWGMRFLTLLLAAGDTNFTLHASLNWHVLGAAAALSLLTGLLFGLAPALQSTRVDVMPALKEIRAGRARSRFRLSLSGLLVVTQIGLSLVLLVAAGLFVRTLSNLESVQLGFNRDNLLLFELNARQAGHRDPEIVSFYSDLQKQFQAIPGVRHASLSHTSLFSAGTGLLMRVNGAEVAEATRLLFVGPEFFTTMQIPILLGREVQARDQPGSPGVAVVSELFAKTNFGDRNPIGRHIELGRADGSPAVDMEVVGVAKEARYGGLKRQIPPVVYIPFHQRPSYYPVKQMVFELRTTGDPLRYVNSVRGIVHRADARVPVTGVETQVAEIDDDISQEITFAKLCSAFAVLALAIACIGLYGTLSYNIARRNGEIGIRMALGAPRAAVVGMILREVLVLALLGLMIGVSASLAGSKLVTSFLFGMKPNDPLALALAIAILLAAALLAGYMPAWKASRIDPLSALRHE